MPKKPLPSKGRWLLKLQFTRLVIYKNLQLTQFWFCYCCCCCCWNNVCRILLWGKTSREGSLVTNTDCFPRADCIQNSLQCWILLKPVFYSSSSKFSNYTIYFLLINWSSFLFHLNSCSRDLPIVTIMNERSHASENPMEHQTSLTPRFSIFGAIIKNYFKEDLLQLSVTSSVIWLFEMQQEPHIPVVSR